MNIIYVIFCWFLWLWTNDSVTAATAWQSVLYVYFMALTIGVGMLASVIWRKNTAVLWGIYIALILVNFGGSIAFRTGKDAMLSYFKDFCYMILVFVLVYLVIRYTKIYQLHIFNILLAIILPMIPLLARFTTEEKNGAYLSVGKLQIYGLILAGYVFVAAYFLSFLEKRYLWGNVRTISFNLVGLLIYTILLFIGSALCNEFGLLLILGLTSTLLFFVKCKTWIPKFTYSGLCLAGALLIAKEAQHVRNRIQIWLHLKAVAGNEDLESMAETVLYLFRNFKRTGWWGNGIGDLPKSIYTTLNTDHVLVTLFHDYGGVIAILIIALLALLVKYMLFEKEGLSMYDRYLNLASALEVGFIVLVHIASNLGSFITAGQGMPWTSDGITSNLMFTVMIGIHCGLNGRRRVNWDEDDKNEEIVE